jgi:elongation factor 1-beta
MERDNPSILSVGLKMKLPSLSTAEGLASLDRHLLDTSFISGYGPSRADLTVLKQIGQTKISLEHYANIARWSRTIKSYTNEEQKDFPGGEPIEIELASDTNAASAANSEVE